MQNQQLKQLSHQQLIDFLTNKSKECRLSIIEMLTQAQSSHLGSAFSIVEILVTLYNCFITTDLIKSHDDNRDIFILSKGHAASALYATLASVGLIANEALKNYHHNGSKLSGHPIKDSFTGIEASTGSLGHGLSMGVGMAIAAKNDNSPKKIYVLLGDGECQEGAIWEALFVASRYKLNNLIIIVDYNKLQAYDRTNDLIAGSLQERFTAFGCDTATVDGHDYKQLINTINLSQHSAKPRVIIANTIKGKGLSIAEDKLEWHYKSLNPQQYEAAKIEVMNS